MIDKIIYNDGKNILNRDYLNENRDDARLSKFMSHLLMNSLDVLQAKNISCKIVWCIS